MSTSSGGSCLAGGVAKGGRVRAEHLPLLLLPKANCDFGAAALPNDVDSAGSTEGGATGGGGQTELTPSSLLGAGLPTLLFFD